MMTLAKPSGYGDALADALVLYKRLLFEGVVHSLVLRAGGRDHNSWEVSWQSWVGSAAGEDQWVKIKIVQRDLHVLGRFALVTLERQARPAVVRG